MLGYIYRYKSLEFSVSGLEYKCSYVRRSFSKLLRLLHCESSATKQFRHFKLRFWSGQGAKGLLLCFEVLGCRVGGWDGCQQQQSGLCSGI